MANTYFTADPHFGHDNIIKFCNRPYRKADGTPDSGTMNEDLIRRWNETVQNDDDTVYVLGDFAYRIHNNLLRDIFGRLRGRKYLILGNHDHSDVRRLPWAEQPVHYKEMQIGNDFVVLCHYSMRSWNKSFHGSLMLYGHTHAALPAILNSIDVGVDNGWDFRPVTLEQIKARLASMDLLKDKGNI